MSKAAGVIRQLKLQHTLFTVVLLLGITGAFIYAGMATIPANESLERTGSMVAVILAVGLVLLGFNLFKRKIMEARNSQESAFERTAKYAKACLVWWIMIYTPALVSLGLFICTAYYSFIALSIVLWLILFLFRPRKANIAMLVRLTEQDL